jgi:hypothetical protein
VAQFHVEIVAGCVTKDSRRLFGHMLRYEYEAEWLRQNSADVDRVIHSDSYDVFFQADPFRDFVPRDRILLVKEDLMIAECDWNSQWIQECYDKPTWFAIRNNNIICTGVICGSASEYLRMITFLISRPEWRRCWDESKDQPIFNNLHWSGVLRDQGFEFNYTNCFNGIFTMHWCQGDRPFRVNDQNLVITPLGDVPFLLHQYNRFQKIIDHLAAKCHMVPFVAS